jgi:hypothetical protein
MGLVFDGLIGINQNEVEQKTLLKLLSGGFFLSVAIAVCRTHLSSGCIM